MIRVERSRVPRPEVLSDAPDSPATLERNRAIEFFGSSQPVSSQRRFSFQVFRDPTVVGALRDLFYSKCAYCEARLGLTTPGDLEHFRPRSGVTENTRHPGYWWLAAAWENLLISCEQCNRAHRTEGAHTGKANRFPLVDESKRAFAPGGEKDEQPLLLDPCADYPENDLVFDDDGTVASATPRGQTTIVVLGLNRPGLVAARREAAERVRQLLRQRDEVSRSMVTADSPLRPQFDALVQQLKSLTGASEEFAALKRQLIRRDLDATSSKAAVDRVVEDWEVGVPRMTTTRRKQAKQSFRTFQEAQSDFSLNEEAGREKFRTQRRQIERVSIKDFKGIRSLVIDLELSSGRTGWLMLLGENGTGKSSVLQAIALTLAGADYLAKLAVDRGLSMNHLVRFGAREAEISVKLSGFVGPHELTLTSKRATCRKPNGEVAHVDITAGKATVKAKKRSGETQSVVLGYGATRLLPHHRTTRYGIEYSRVDNLFDPFLPLFDAEKWLMDLDGPTFNEFGIVLKDLLALDEQAELLRDKTRVLLREHGVPVPIRSLSDGYQAVVAMSVDILEVAKRLWPKLQDAEGIVLLDEIGAHFHPAWKMRIVESMRRAFPGMQFIATTHDPLCLRGLGEGEVVVMRRDQAQNVEAVCDLPSPSDFRVDQLLTSEFFGLHSTFEPEVEKDFDQYYALLALTTRSPDQEAMLGALRDKLKDRRYLGNTLREQLMYEAVDHLVARQKHGERKPIPQLKREAVEELSRLWSAKV